MNLVNVITPNKDYKEGYIISVAIAKIHDLFIDIPEDQKIIFKKYCTCGCGMTKEGKYFELCKN